VKQVISSFFNHFLRRTVPMSMLNAGPVDWLVIDDSSSMTMTHKYSSHLTQINLSFLSPSLCLPLAWAPALYRQVRGADCCSQDV
jgi:hypothetical protein